MCSCLIDPNAIYMIGWMHCKWFYDARHQIVFQAILNVHEAGIPIDTVSVSDALERSGQLLEIGGDAFLVGLSNVTATSAYVEHYAKIVRDYAAKRAIGFLCERVSNSAYNGKPSDELIAQLMRGVDKVNSALTGSNPRELSVSIPQALDDIEAKRRRDKQDYPQSGLSQLHDKLGDFEPGTMTLIAARPSVGKSDIALNWAYNMGKRFNVAFVSIEMSEPAIMRRLLALHSGIDRLDMKKGNLTDEEMAQIYKRADVAERLIHFEYNANTVPLIRAVLATMKAKYGVCIAFIDHCHKILFHTNYKSDLNNRRGVVDGIHTMARDLKLPVILLYQLNRESDNKEFGKKSSAKSRRPVLSDLREAGEEPSDNVLMLYREHYQERVEVDELEIIIRKARDASLGTVKCRYDLTTGKQTQIDTPKDAPQQENKYNDETPF